MGSRRTYAGGAREPKGVPRQDGPESEAVGAASGVSGRDRHGHQPAVASDAARHATTEMGGRPPPPPYSGIAPGAFRSRLEIEQKAAADVLSSESIFDD